MTTSQVIDNDLQAIGLSPVKLSSLGGTRNEGCRDEGFHLRTWDTALVSQLSYVGMVASLLARPSSKARDMVDCRVGPSAQRFLLFPEPGSALGPGGCATVGDGDEGPGGRGVGFNSGNYNVLRHLSHYLGILYNIILGLQNYGS